MMGEFFAGTRLIDLVIAFTALEAVALAAYRRRTGRGLALGDYAVNLAAGLCLMLALRAALVAASWPWIALCLLAAGIAHGADLQRRWAR